MKPSKNPKLKGLLFDKSGFVFHLKRDRKLEINNRGYFSLNGEQYNLAKCLIEIFNGVKVRAGQINHLDGDRANFSIENIEYHSKQEKRLKPSENDLKTLFSNHFIVPEDFKIKNDFSFRLGLSIIADNLSFFERFHKAENINVFRDYLDVAISPSQYALSKKFEMPVRDIQFIINRYLQLLIDENLMWVSKIKINKSKVLLKSNTKHKYNKINLLKK